MMLLSPVIMGKMMLNLVAEQIAMKKPGKVLLLM